MFGRFSSKLTLGLVTVTPAFAVLFHGELDGDFAVHEELSVHVGNGGISSFEGSVRDEAITLGEIGVVASDLFECQSSPKV